MFENILSNAVSMLDYCDSLEPTSAIKECASLAGVDHGEEMKEVVEWCLARIVNELKG